MGERWKFEKVGMGYQCWSDEAQTRFRLTHIKRSRGDLTGELSIEANIKDLKTHNGIVHVARFNVLSSSSRSSLAKMLEKRTPEGVSMDWFDGLEWLCQNVILSETRGEPINEVGLNPPTPAGKQWMVEPLVLKGRASMIFGPGGVGKSLVGLTCGLSVAAGREIIPGIVPAAHGNVLYLDWETTADVINDRIQAIARGHNFKPAGMLYRRCVRPLADDAEELSSVVAERKVVMVVVDSAAYAMGAQGEYGDANESVLRMHEAIRLIGATTLIIDHVNKTDQRAKPGTATPYGSAYKTNAVRISWEVRKAPSANGLAINLYHAKSNDTRQMEPIGLALEWDEGIIRFAKSSVIEEEPEEDHRVVMSAGALILDLLSDGERMSRKAIENTFPGIKPSTIGSALSRLTKSGQLLNVNGDYQVPQAPAFRFSSGPGSKGVDA